MDEEKRMTAGVLYHELKRHVDDCMKDRQENTRALEGMRSDINTLKNTLKGYQDAFKSIRKNFWQGIFAIVVAILAAGAGMAVQNWMSPQSDREQHLLQKLERLYPDKAGTPTP